MRNTGDDPELIGADIFFAASKNRSYRESVKTMFATLATFLEENGLTTRQLLPPGRDIDQSFVLRRADLTEEGVDFYHRLEKPWLAGIDRGGPASSTRVMKRVLDGIRKPRPGKNG
jgi:hypothetical protein